MIINVWVVSFSILLVGEKDFYKIIFKEESKKT